MPHLWNNVLQAYICCVLIGKYIYSLIFDPKQIQSLKTYNQTRLQEIHF